MKLILSILFLSLFIPCFAQRQNVYFLKNDGRYVQSRDSADFIRVIREPDSGSVYYNVFEFYTKGSRRFIGKSSKIETLDLEGQGIDFFANGIKKTVANYKNNKLTGPVYNYYPSGKFYNAMDYTPNINPINGNDVSGYSYESIRITDCRDSMGKQLLENGNGYFIDYQDDFSYVHEEGKVKNGKKDSIWHGQDKGLKIKFTEVYKDGKLLTGEAIDSSGIKHTYIKRSISPQYIGGAEALYAYLGTHIIYPDYARANNIQGVVILSFTVKKDGSLEDIKVYKSADRLLDNEAIRVLKRSKSWQCGVYFGSPVNIQYTLPVSFSLKD